MMVQMLGVFAEFERATIIDRVIAGMERKAAHGGWNGGGIPFGYALDRATGKLVTRADQAPLVATIFELYLKRRWGAHKVAAWLNDHGHRTSLGKPWGYRSVLTMLRNEAYLGRVNFRGKCHPAAHPPLVDEMTFRAAQELLDERGEDPGRRRSNASDYLLAGLLRCQRCGRHYIGAAAHGHGGRYRYYVCQSRDKRGSYGCDGQRLPADALERGLIASLIETFTSTDLMDRAVHLAAEASREAQVSAAQRLAGVNREISKTKESLDRYFAAFESGRMSEETAAPRIEALSANLRELGQTRVELEAAKEDEEAVRAPSAADLEAVRAELASLLGEADSRVAKALLNELVAEVRVESRASIQPVFKLPTRQVRVLHGMVGGEGLEPSTSALSALRSAC